jgi:microcystin-dependent protein
MTTGGVLTMGSLTSNIINNSTTTNNSQATFNNSTPICSVATPTAVNHLTRKDYIDNNFAGLTSANSFSGVNTFTNNTNFSSSITFTDIANFSTIQQSSAVLNIENPTLSSTIKLKTRASTGAVQNSLTLNTASCDILSPTLNLTSTTPTSILTPNNLNGTINLFNNLTTGGTLNIGSTSGVNVINGNTSITNTLTVNGNATCNNYIKTKQGLWIYDAMYPYTNFMELSLLGTAMQFVPSFNSNSYQIYTNDASGITHIPITINDASTTLNHQLICNNGAVFNTTLPTSTINASSSNQFTIRGFTDATYQTIASMASYLTSSAAALLYQEKIVGSIIQMAMGTVPSGYLACNGGSYSSSTYPALSTFLNFTYGGSSGSGMFQVPDFRGMFLRGNGTNGIDSTYASATYGSLQTDGIRAHTHDILFGYLTTTGTGGGGNAYNSTSPNYNNPGSGGGRATGITSTNANPYPDTRPGNFAVFYCIKY